MITLTTVTYLHEADFLCMKLEMEGVKTFLPDQSTASIQPLYAGAIGGIRIQVEEEDLVRAREVLADSLPAKNPGSLQCPECASDSVDYVRVSKAVAFLNILFLGIPLLWLKRLCLCNACGNTWKEIRKPAS